MLAKKKKDNKNELTLSDDDLALLAEDEENQEAIELEARTNELIANMRRKDNVWGLSNRAVQGVKLAMASISTTHGLQARVPMICKGENCAYAKQCPLLPYGEIEEGKYCLWEIGQIQYRAAGYASDLDYDSASFTDKNLMSELIMLDIMLERCKSLLANEGTPVIDMAIGVDQEGNEIRQPNVSKAWEAYEKISKKRDQTYQLLMLTRKDKAKQGTDDDARNLTDELRNVIDTVNVQV